METLSEVRGYVRDHLQDPNKKIWRDADIDQHINLACVDLQEQTEFIEDTSFQAITSGTADYERDTDVIQNMRWQEFDRYRLNSVDIYEMDRKKFDWRTDQPSNVPIRVYRKDWKTDSYYPTPNVTGDSGTDNAEVGLPVRMTTAGQDTSDTSELGLVTLQYLSDGSEGFQTLRTVIADRDSDSLGIDVFLGSPYGNVFNVFSRYPDELVNDDDPLPFPDWCHPAIEELAIAMLFEKEGDGQNFQDAKFHRDLYTNFWLPFVHRMIDRRTPDKAITWKGQRRDRAYASRLSRMTPWNVGRMSSGSGYWR